MYLEKICNRNKVLYHVPLYMSLVYLFPGKFSVCHLVVSSPPTLAFSSHFWKNFQEPMEPVDLSVEGQRMQLLVNIVKWTSSKVTFTLVSINCRQVQYKHIYCMPILEVTAISF